MVSLLKQHTKSLALVVHASEIFKVMEDEIEAIRQGMRNFGKAEAGTDNYSPNIVCIIACKRHNKRFAIENG